MSVVPFAHERWFVNSYPGGDWHFATSPLVLTLLGAVVLATIAWRLVALRLSTPELKVLAPVGRLVPWIPRLLGIHLGVALLALASTGAFLSPAVDNFTGSGAALVLLIEAGLGVWLISGVQVRYPAVVVVTLGPVLAFLAGPMALLESANVVAVAAFLVVVPAGRDSYGAVDAASPARLRLGLLSLRVGVGVALIALAFTEKLTNPQMAEATLKEFPQLDVFGWVGIDIAPHTFVAIAGSIEVLFGLLVISGAMPQVAALVAAVPFNATLVLFGQTELVGHLPVYGVFLALIVYGADSHTAPLVRWLPSRDGTRRRSLQAIETREQPARGVGR